MDLANWTLRTLPTLQGLNINSIRVFDQIRDPEILITHRPHILTKLFPLLLSIFSPYNPITLQLICIFHFYLFFFCEILNFVYD